MIRGAPGSISRAQIAQTLELSRSTVSAIVEELVDAGLLVERGAGISRGGRRPIVLDINPDAGRVVGVDVGATHLYVLVADLLGRVVGTFESPLSIADGPEHCLKQAMSGVTRALGQARVDFSAVTAIAVGVPGPVILDAGMVQAPPIMPGWDSFPIRRRLAELWSLKIPVSVDNDADLGALGEWAYGAGRGEQHLAYIKVGTGIGCGVLLHGRVYHGARGTAGEIGHITINEEGPPCTCGNSGCLEAMASGRAIAMRARLAVQAGQPTRLASVTPPEALTARDVAAFAQQGDPVAQQVLADAGRYIGIAIASLINLLNPSLVIVGGGVARSGDLLLEPVRVTVRERSMRSSFQATRIVPAALGERSTALGAVALALNQTFECFVSGDLEPLPLAAAYAG
jgi:glucokinase-like ROK family protein